MADIGAAKRRGKKNRARSDKKILCHDDPSELLVYISLPVKGIVRVREHDLKETREEWLDRERERERERTQSS